MEVRPESFPQTPMYRALQSDRYARQEIIKNIQTKTGRKLIVYEANIGSPYSGIIQGDIQLFEDLFAHLPPKQNIDLLLQSPGGDADAAEKIVYICRQSASGFRVIIPEYAKSAATLIALASDEVVMGFTSELGPIDTQISGPGPGGAPFQTSAQSFIDEFERIKEEVKETKELSAAYYPILDGFNLGFLGMCRNAVERSKKFAEKWLKEYMLKGDGKKAAEIAAELSDVKKWLSHGIVIDADEAEKLGIKVYKLGRDDDLWKCIWYLHCCYGMLFMKTNVVKIFESETVSLPVG